MEPGALTAVLNGFLGTFTLGLARATPEALALLRYIVTIELLFVGLWITLGHMNELSMTLVTIAIKITFYVWLVSQWQALARLLARLFIGLGLAASGDIITQADFTDPSALAGWGLSAMALTYNRIFGYSGLTAIYYLPDIFLTGIAATLVSLAFGVFAIQVFVTLFEFYALATVVVVCLPFGFIRYTAFVAEKAIAVMWASALKLLVLSFITGLSIPQIVKMSPGLNPTFGQILTLAITAWALVVLAWRAPQMAMGLLHGAPVLTAETVARAAQSSVNTVMNMAQVVRSMAGTPPAPAAASTARRRP